MSKPNSSQESKVHDVCPHCGAQLSPWQQVLLSVDRALMCRSCWYRIVLTSPDDSQEGKKDETSHSKGASK
jgi:DNA-directed RNA polymerase subunit RPC12/RpoP